MQNFRHLISFLPEKSRELPPAVSFSEGKMQYAQPFLPYRRITLIASRIMAAVMARMQA